MGSGFGCFVFGRHTRGQVVYYLWNLANVRGQSLQGQQGPRCQSIRIQTIRDTVTTAQLREDISLAQGAGSLDLGLWTSCHTRPGTRSPPRKCFPSPHARGKAVLVHTPAYHHQTTSEKKRAQRSRDSPWVTGWMQGWVQTQDSRCSRW